MRLLSIAAFCVGVISVSNAIKFERDYEKLQKLPQIDAVKLAEAAKAEDANYLLLQGEVALGTAAASTVITGIGMLARQRSLMSQLEG